MTTNRLDQIEARAKAATEGPWEVDGLTASAAYEVISPSGFAAIAAIVATDAIEEDAEFIAHARTDVPDLVAFVRGVERILRSGMPPARSLIEIEVGLDRLNGGA